MSTPPGAPPFPLDRIWIYKISVLADLVAQRVGARVKAVSGLNLSQWRVLAAIGDGPGRTASQVVDLTPMDKTIVSRAAASLVEQGLVERRASAKDGRLSHLFLTMEGQRVYEAIVADLDRSGASGRGALPDAEEAAFLAQLEALIAAYREG